MKYLHSGYILFCRDTERSDNGMLNLQGIFDVFVVKELPHQSDCSWVIGFGTPYERRQYKGTVQIENPAGKEVYSGEFSANDPNDIYKGHHVFKPNLKLDNEGMWSVRVTLRNWKDENMWDFERKFWCMLEPANHPDP